MFLRVARWIPANGIAFVILVVIAALLTRDSPGGDASEAEIASYYADADNLQSERISFFLVGLAAFCFLLFLGGLRGAPARAEGDPVRLTTATVAAAGVFIALAVAGMSSHGSWPSASCCCCNGAQRRRKRFRPRRPY
jgi:hypothetical protein